MFIVKTDRDSSWFIYRKQLVYNRRTCLTGLIHLIHFSLQLCILWSVQCFPLLNTYFYRCWSQDTISSKYLSTEAQTDINSELSAAFKLNKRELQVVRQGESALCCCSHNNRQAFLLQLGAWKSSSLDSNTSKCQGWYIHAMTLLRLQAPRQRNMIPRRQK